MMSLKTRSPMHRINWRNAPAEYLVRPNAPVIPVWCGFFLLLFYIAVVAHDAPNGCAVSALRAIFSSPQCKTNFIQNCAKISYLSWLLTAFTLWDRQKHNNNKTSQITFEPFENKTQAHALLSGLSLQPFHSRFACRFVLWQLQFSIVITVIFRSFNNITSI